MRHCPAYVGHGCPTPPGQQPAGEAPVRGVDDAGHDPTNDLKRQQHGHVPSPDYRDGPAEGIYTAAPDPAPHSAGAP